MSDNRVRNMLESVGEWFQDLQMQTLRAGKSVASVHLDSLDDFRLQIAQVLKETEKSS